jgi:hypothetical protein
MTLTWSVPTSWADAANGPLARVNICGILRINLQYRHVYESISNKDYI